MGNLMGARRNGKPLQPSGEHSTVDHPPIPALHSQLPYSLAAVFAGIGCKVPTIRRISNSPYFINTFTDIVTQRRLGSCHLPCRARRKIWLLRHWIQPCQRSICSSLFPSCTCTFTQSSHLFSTCPGRQQAASRISSREAHHQPSSSRSCHYALPGRYLQLTACRSNEILSAS